MGHRQGTKGQGADSCEDRTRVGGGRESNDVVFHVTVKVPSPTAVHEKVALLPTVADVLVGGAVMRH